VRRRADPVSITPPLIAASAMRVLQVFVRRHRALAGCLTDVPSC
jgi:hypothetical protein